MTVRGARVVGSQAPLCATAHAVGRLAPYRRGRSRTLDRGARWRLCPPARALGAIARRRRMDAGDVAIDSRVSLLPTADRAFKLAVALAVSLPSVPDPDTEAELVRAAHQVCPYSNATRGNIDIALSVNGRAVDPTAA